MRLARAGLGLLLVCAASSALSAQTIRGTIVDDSLRLPVASVLVTLLDEAGTEVLPGVRSDSLGNFMIHATRTGSWRVKAARIGFNPVTSEPVSLAVGSLAVLQLRMTTVAQQLVPVRIVEQRLMSASELMSTTGFDLRERRGVGRFLSGERLSAMRLDGLGEILNTYFQPALYVLDDPVLGPVLRIRQGARDCEPEIYLDGRLLATAADSNVVFSTTPPTTAIDSMRAQSRAESENMRMRGAQINAMGLLASMVASQIHGIELYRSNEVPPPSLGGWFGMTKVAVDYPSLNSMSSPRRTCGTLAVWTKAGAKSVVTARNNAASGRAVQVVTGTLVDLETGRPIAGKPIALLNEKREKTGAEVISDERGEFTLRTGRAGDFRLMSGGDEYRTSTSPAFPVTANEMVVVRLSISTKETVLAPLGVSARLLPQNIALTSLSGFTYRRERAQGGIFFRAADIEQSGKTTIPDLLRSIDGVVPGDSARPIIMTRPGEAPACSPSYYLDGTPVAAASQARLLTMPLASLFGVEVYTRPSEIPAMFTDAGKCGLVVLWTRR